MSGPKIRVGKFAGGRVELADGQRVTVTTRDAEGGPGLIPSQYQALARDVGPGSRILLDDGNLELAVESVEGTEIQCKVADGGVLSDHKGMNLPGVHVSAPSLTEKDRADAAFALGLGVDMLALSFVRQASDVLELRALADKKGADAALIAKIEKPEALENIKEILEASDGIMVARGDLGIELAQEKVPHVQDQLILLARSSRKPVIVATQMLQSMMDNPRPTRAEVTDAAHAVRSGADAVMLSGETAVGRYPAEAVKMLDTIARQTEGLLWRQGAFGGLRQDAARGQPAPVENAVADATAMLSRDLRVRAIVVVSYGGRSIAVMSSAHPAAPIVGVSAGAAAGGLACLLWGVLPVTVEKSRLRDIPGLAKNLAGRFGLASRGERILVVRGFSSDPAKNNPAVSVVTV